ncbi:MAG: hypothetical protein KGH94_03985 [Candidatus Micrarchaeota archaeon]|nr:hypothetical protein [Candidatus Micrarchaeota archaeon]
MDQNRIREMRKIAVDRLESIAFYAPGRDTRLRAFEALRGSAERTGEVEVVKVIKYLSREGPEDVSSTATRWLRRMEIS